MSFDRAGLVFVFNFHPNKSFTDYPIGVQEPGKYKVILNSDDPQFGGENRIDVNVDHFSIPDPWADRPNRILTYVPCRTATVYAKGNFQLLTLHFSNFKHFKTLISFRDLKGILKTHQKSLTRDYIF